MSYVWFLAALSIGTMFGLCLSLMFSGTDCDSCSLNDNDNPPDLKWRRAPLGAEASPVQPEDMNEVDREIWSIFKDAFTRYKRGEAQYGVLQIETDQRDFLVESEQELLDSMVYDSVEVSRLRRIRKNILGRVGAPCGAPWGFP